MTILEVFDLSKRGTFLISLVTNLLEFEAKHGIVNLPLNVLQMYL
jgi:hypothetical protein